VDHGSKIAVNGSRIFKFKTYNALHNVRRNSGPSEESGWYDSKVLVES